MTADHSPHDSLQRLLFERAGVRAQAVRLDQAWQTILSRHPGLDPAATTLLGESAAAACLLSAALKFDGSVILQLHGDGPLRLLVSECSADLGLRATLRLSEAAIAAGTPLSSDLTELCNQTGQGRFSLVLASRLEHVAPYQGIVQLNDSTLAGVLEDYMQRSEQLPTRLWLAADGQHASGLLIQQMPLTGGKAVQADREESWSRISILANTLTRDELLGLSVEQLLHRLFWEEEPLDMGRGTPVFTCPCSRERVGRMLQSLGWEEVRQILAEQGSVKTSCDFCNADYILGVADCEELFGRPMTGLTDPDVEPEEDEEDLDPSQDPGSPAPPSDRIH